MWCKKVGSLTVCADNGSMKYQTSFRLERATLDRLDRIADEQGINRTQALVWAVNKYRDRVDATSVPTRTFEVVEALTEEMAEIKRSLQEIRWMITRLKE